MTMQHETGARRSESLRESPGFKKVSNFDRTLKGVIKPDGVIFSDATGNPSGTTLVNIMLYGGYSELQNVPILHSKINNQNGEEWTPEPGDVVLVTFINGNFWEPVVIGYLPLPSNVIEATQADVPAGRRRYHQRCNKTDVVIDKNGNRTTNINGNETVTIKNSETVTVQLGDITVDVVAGKCTVHIKGKTAWQSEGTIDLDGTSTGEVKGIIQGDCICGYTGKKHIMVSASVKGSK